jgi:hypothetical protein
LRCGSSDWSPLGQSAAIRTMRAVVGWFVSAHASAAAASEGDGSRPSQPRVLLGRFGVGMVHGGRGSRGAKEYTGNVIGSAAPNVVAFTPSAMRRRPGRELQQEKQAATWGTTVRSIQAVRRGGAPARRDGARGCAALWRATHSGVPVGADDCCSRLSGRRVRLVRSHKGALQPQRLCGKWRPRQRMRDGIAPTRTRTSAAAWERGPAGTRTGARARCPLPRMHGNGRARRPGLARPLLGTRTARKVLRRELCLASAEVGVGARWIQSARGRAAAACCASRQAAAWGMCAVRKVKQRPLQTRPPPPPLPVVAAAARQSTWSLGAGQREGPWLGAQAPPTGRFHILRRRRLRPATSLVGARLRHPKGRAPCASKGGSQGDKLE